MKFLVASVSTKSNCWLRRIGASWAIFGIFLIIIYAIWRLGTRASLALEYQLGLWHYVLLIVWSGYMVYYEGVKGFGRSFSPRAVARAQYLASQGGWWQILAGPLFCFGYFATNRRRKVAIYGLTFGIIGFIWLIQLLPQPWRGIIDAGAVFGLTYGAGTLLYFALKARNRPDNYLVDPEVK